MRVLLIHNFYRSSAPSGEDEVYRAERRLLEANGVEVVCYERHNDALEPLPPQAAPRVAVDTVWARRSYSELRRLIRDTRPQLAHVHNTFPQISPSAYLACRAEGVPVVQTLHNYRLICAGALLLRDGRPCENCVGRIPLPALVHRCYRGSLPATAALTAMHVWHRAAGTYRDAVDRYVALTRFAAGRFAAGGLPAERIRVRGNYVADPGPPGDGAGGFALFVGRLAAEKGVETLLEAWRLAPDLPPLVVAGDGPLRATLEAQAASLQGRVRLVGRQPRERVLQLMRDSRLLVVPSQWYEGFPLVVIESYACGTPIVASALGGLAEHVEDGVTGRLHAPGEPAALAAAVRDLAGRADLAAFRRRARARFEARHSQVHAYASLASIYAELV